MNTLSKKLTALDARFKNITPERYARSLLVPSCVVILALVPALLVWGADGPFRVNVYPHATLIWAVSLPLAFLSYEGLVATWRAPLKLSQKLVFSLCHLFAIALSLIPIVVLIIIICAIGGVNGDR